MSAAANGAEPLIFINEGKSVVVDNSSAPGGVSYMLPPWWFTRKRDQDRLNEMFAKLKAWNIPAGALDAVHTEGKASLAAIQALTEYEDGKVARLLTIVAFLSAIVGVVFTRFASDYVWVTAPTNPWLPIVTYVTFFLYIISVSFAVLLLLSAIRPTFNAPRSWIDSESDQPRSLFFYIGVLAVTAPKWAQAFKELAGVDGSELKSIAAKNYVAEAYLIAEKIAHKLWWVQRGVWLLQFAMIVLVFFFSLYAATMISVAPTKSSAGALNPAGGRVAPSPNPTSQARHAT